LGDSGIQGLGDWGIQELWDWGEKGMGHGAWGIGHEEEQEKEGVMETEDFWYSGMGVEDWGACWPGCGFGA